METIAMIPNLDTKAFIYYEEKAERWKVKTENWKVKGKKLKTKNDYENN